MTRFNSTEARNASRRANYAQTQADRPYRFWTQEEDRAVLNRATSIGGAVRRDLTDRELSAILDRSVQAIQIRRSRLGGTPS